MTGDRAPISPSPTQAIAVLVRGQVQGVGFRPFVQRLAADCGLSGSIANTNAGLALHLEGHRDLIEAFLHRLPRELPAAAAIEALSVERTAASGRHGFHIEDSASFGPVQVRLPPDLALCPQCYAELHDPANRRRRYPFIACTTCGPRASIVEALPYSRKHTGMKCFALCLECRREFEDLTDRRCHAEAIACPTCGPKVRFISPARNCLESNERALLLAVETLRREEILALKGLGGFQLLARADAAAAVARLRQRKRRPTKPLAVMLPWSFRNELRKLMPEAEFALLTSPLNPIVLVAKHLLRRLSLANCPSPAQWADGVAPGVATWGVMLPTSPLHDLLLADLGVAVVCTSGNVSEAPLALDDEEAFTQLSDVADGFLTHDRPILRRLDDSVAQVVAGKPSWIRLGRGFAPLQVPALESLAHRIGAPPLLAVGGQQKSAVACWTGSQALLGPHIGDLKHPASMAAFEACIADLKRLYRFEPEQIACDRHPDYAAHRWAHSQGKPVLPVQHHHAHALACLAEHGRPVEEALAVTWDGTGYGVDGTIWGGECLHVRGTGFKRLSALRPFPLLGGEAAVRQPARIALGLLWTLFGGSLFNEKNRWLGRLGFREAEAKTLVQMIDRQVNTVWTSSMGRLFDGVAALVLSVHRVSYEGEAAVLLEAEAEVDTERPYSLPVLPCMVRARNTDGGRLSSEVVSTMDYEPLLRDLLFDLDQNVASARIAGRFHLGLAEAVASAASQAQGLPILLTGGCFQNRRLTELTIDLLRSRGREVLWHQSLPTNDGGLAVGQLTAALLNFAAQRAEAG